MEYILLDFGSFQGYQEIQKGSILRYVGLDGIINANPIRQGWMINA
jgi:hypothetical protein